MIDTLTELQDLISRHVTAPQSSSAVPGLNLLQADTVSPCSVQTVYSPMVCIIAQGRKRVVVGNATLDYDAAQYLISSVHLPVSGNVTEATPDRPYLALSLALDPKILGSFLLELPWGQRNRNPTRGIAVSRCAPDLLEIFVRLARLLDRPAEIGPLAPLMIREIHYRLLIGDHADMLREIAVQESRTAQIMRVIDWIRQNFARPLQIRTLTRLAGMSPASLHRHFKAITSMSPLQYQKQLRLQEARHLLVSGNDNAAAAGYAVGYGSPSQFSREYHRLFGQPPRQDIKSLQRQASN